MDIKATVGTIALIAVGGAAAIWLYNTLTGGQNAPATARAVTSTAKTGSLRTSPLNPGKIAAVALNNPLDWVGSVTNRAAQAIPTNLSNGAAATNWRVPYGNPESAQAASNAPKATNVSNYRPTSWASVPFRSGV